MFEQRAKSQLYVLGDFTHIGDEEKIPEVYESVLDGEYFRMHTPWKVDTGGITIAQVGAVAPDIRLIDSTGTLFFPKVPKDVLKAPCAMVHMDARMKNVPDKYKSGREDIAMQKFLVGIQEAFRAELGPAFPTTVNIPEGLGKPARELVEFSNKLFSQPYKPIEFVDIAAARNTLALDNTGMVWTIRHTKRAAPLCILDRRTSKPITGRITKVRLSTKYSSCFVEGRGIAAWATIEDDDNNGPSVPNGVRSGFLCFEDRVCSEHARLVSGSELATDYAVVESVVVFLNSDGTVGGVDLAEDDDQVCSDMGSVVDMINTKGPFRQIVGSDAQFGFITENGSVVVASILEENPDAAFVVHTLNLPAGETVASIAFGSTHTLILSDAGDVYAWGAEFHLNGCMGLGKLEDIWKVANLRVSGEDNDILTLSQPTKISLPGRAYGVFAYEKYSAILV